MKSHSVISVCMYVKVCVRQRETERQRKTERESMRVDVCNNYTPTSRCVKESFQLQPLASLQASSWPPIMAPISTHTRHQGSFSQHLVLIPKKLGICICTGLLHFV